MFCCFLGCPCTANYCILPYGTTYHPIAASLKLLIILFKWIDAGMIKSSQRICCCHSAGLFSNLLKKSIEIRCCLGTAKLGSIIQPHAFWGASLCCHTCWLLTFVGVGVFSKGRPPALILDIFARPSWSMLLGDGARPDKHISLTRRLIHVAIYFFDSQLCHFCPFCLDVL